MQISKGGVREPENPVEIMELCRGGGEVGAVQRAGASGEEKKKGAQVPVREVDV